MNRLRTTAKGRVDNPDWNSNSARLQGRLENHRPNHRQEHEQAEPTEKGHSLPQGAYARIVRPSSPRHLAELSPGTGETNHPQEYEGNETDQPPDDPEVSERNSELARHPYTGEQEDAHCWSQNRPSKHFALLPQSGSYSWFTRPRDPGIKHRQGEEAPDCDDGRHDMHKLQPEVKRVHRSPPQCSYRSQRAFILPET